MKREEVVIKAVRADTRSAFGVCLQLDGLAILESASVEYGRERYSLILVQEAFTVTQTSDGTVHLAKDGRRFRVGGAGDILDVQRYFANQHGPLRQDLPFPAGGIGYLSYEFAARCDSIRFRKKPDPLELPEAAFVFPHVVVVFDHLTELLYLVGLNYREHQIDLQAAIARLEARLGGTPAPPHEAEEFPAEVVEDPDGRRRYEEGVKSIRNEIVAGNLLQAVLSRRLYVNTELPAIEAYRRLRQANPSPYLFYLNFGTYQLFGSSPEMHVSVKRGRAEMHPIAGTRRRGETAEVDKALEEELLADEKERAEHLMLVDLARNDLGRVCRPASVVVDDFMRVERYSHVMHIVSRVSGTLQEGLNGPDAVRATFPAGTVSGAPKIQAIHTLDGLEGPPRRFYAGIVGYMEPGGDLDTCIAIRSCLAKNGQMVLQAGAGVVYDSDPEREFIETEEKLGALAAAVGIGGAK